jgi:metallo-beta-lactamase family protein
MSAHADYSEILSWLGNFNTPPRKVFVVHGEVTAAQSMRDKIEEKLGWTAEIPQYAQKEEL